MDTTLPALPEDTADPRSQPQRQQPQPGPQTPHHTPDTWTDELGGLWTDTEADPEPLTDSGTDGDLDLWWEDGTDTETEIQKPLRYEDYLRRYLEGDTDLSVLNADTDAAPEKMQQTAPKPKEQIISELAPKISKPGITPGRATIEAQRLYADVERIFGPNADAVLEMFEAGQEPRKFLDGFQNAYLSGRMGSRAALENSGVAAYLTEEQRKYAYETGMMSTSKKSIEKNEKRDKIEYKETKGNYYAARVSTGGHRHESPLTEAQIVEAQNAARKQGFEGEVFYSNYSSTAFHGSAEGHGFCFLVIGTDAYPSLDGKSANERVSVDGCMAHEVVGHYEAWLKGSTQPDPVLEEAQASIRASRFGIGLTMEERADLFEDAMDRLDRAGVSFEQIKDRLDIWER